MTDRSKDIPLSETTPQEEPERGQPRGTTTEEQGEDPGDGQHGRPSDDSDPGHS